MSLWQYGAVIAAVVLADIYCGDVGRNYTSPWATKSNGNLPFQVQFTTTPWPSLNQRKSQLQEAFQQNFQQISTVKPQFSWVRGNNGPNWVRNTPNPPTVNNLNARGSSFGNEDDELREFSEEILNKDHNNVAKFVTVNYQAMTSSRSMKDEAPQPLLSVHSDAFNVKTVSLLTKFYDNYYVDTRVNEVYTENEKQEEQDFIDAIIETDVMEHARNFLIKKDKLGRNLSEFKNLLRTIWFTLYSRGRGKVGSSGFEHVFLAEIKNQQVSGLHNWVYFDEVERKNNANYLGYMKKIDLGNKGAILKYHFTFQNVDKPVGSMFIGTSPELEVALYTTCFVLRANKICPLKLNGHRFIIRTYSYDYKGKKLIGSAFPEI